MISNFILMITIEKYPFSLNSLLRVKVMTLLTKQHNYIYYMYVYLK